MKIRAHQPEACCVFESPFRLVICRTHWHKHGLIEISADYSQICAEPQQISTYTNIFINSKHRIGSLSDEPYVDTMQPIGSVYR